MGLLTPSLSDYVMYFKEVYIIEEGGDNHSSHATSKFFAMHL